MTPFGQIFRLTVTADTKLFRFQASGSAVIYTGSGQSLAGGYIRSSVLGSSIEVMAVDALTWIVMPKTGTWTLDS